MIDKASELRTRIGDQLRAAMRARDRVATGALRSVSAAIANAEAIEVAAGPTGAEHIPDAVGSEHVAGAVGLGAAEADRRELGPDDLAAIVTAEAEQRDVAARTYVDAGHPERAAILGQEAMIIRALLTS